MIPSEFEGWPDQATTTTTTTTPATHQFRVSTSPASNTMMYLFLFTSLFFFHLPHLVTAECPDCNSYSAALTSCQSKTTSGNLTTTGSKIDTGTVDCMCVSGSNTAQMNSCQGCYAASATLNTNDEDVDVSLLLSWYYVCKANDQWGNQQGAACWQGQPLDYVPCVSNTVKKGGGSTSGGSGGSGTSSR